MPMIAAILEKSHGFKTSVAYAKPKPQTKDNIEGLDALATADLLVMFARFRALPDEQLQRILQYVESGKPIVGLRTSTHAFLYPEGHPRQGLNDGFGRDVFGQKWITHHGSQSSTEVAVHAANASHPVLRGVGPFHARSWLYHVAPLNGEATVLLEGTTTNSNKAAKLPSSADPAGGVDAAGQEVPRFLHDTGPPRGLRAGVDAASGDQRHLLGAGTRCAGRGRGRTVLGGYDRHRRLTSRRSM